MDWASPIRSRPRRSRPRRSRPRGSRPDQGIGVVGNSGGSGGSSLPAGGGARSGVVGGTGRSLKAGGAAKAPSISATSATPLSHPYSPSTSGRTGAGFDWWDWGRVGLGRKAVLIDVGEQGLRFGVERPELDVLEPQLLGLFLDLLGFFPDPLAVAPHSQDLDLDLFRTPFALLHSQLVTGIASPIERRQKLSPPRQR